jgi:DNA end-binding protein Ku
VILTRDELKSIPAESSHEIEVVQFVPSEQLDPIMFERSYYLEPDSKSPKAYVLLRRALEDTDRVAVVQFALREKTRLGALRIRNDVLVLQSLLWADEVREASFPALETPVRISAQEREMSAALVDSMAGDFEPEQFTDEYQVQLRKLIEAKLEEGESLDTEKTFGAEAAQAGTGEVIDLMEALKRSIEKKRGGGAAGSRGAAEEDEATPAAKAPARRAAAKTTAAKTPAAKTTAGKTSAGTSAAKTSAAKTTRAKASPARKTPANASDAKTTAASEPAKNRRKGA